MNLKAAMRTLTIGAFTGLGPEAAGAAVADASAVHAVTHAATASLVSGSDGGAGNG